MSNLARISRCYTITFERTSKHPVEAMWRAITDPARVSRWMSYPARIDLRVGGDYHVDFSRTGEGALDGVIVRVEPPRTLAYVWGLSVLEWRFEPQRDGCRYTFVHHGQSPPDQPDGEDIAAGWHLWLEDFEAHLEGAGPSEVDRDTRWRDLKPEYLRLLESALGPERTPDPGRGRARERR